MSAINRLLLIGNPASKSGKGAAAIKKAAAYLRRELGEGSVDVVETQAPGHAVRIAAASRGYDVVAALGGDGVVHEVANGLMTISPECRPVLGLLPMGSGNDYARSLGVSFTLRESLRQLLQSRIETVDVGKCNDEYFVETLSFGLDAAIAADTMERRKRTGRSGLALYAASGFDQLFHHLRSYGFTAQLKGCSTRNLDGEAFLFAVNLGKTYGGGFKVCPEASLTDGFFDVCIARPPLSVPVAAGLFMLAKEGRHTGFKQIEQYRITGATIDFEDEPKVQLDGESITGRHFEVSLLPRSLNVLIPLR